MTRRWIVPVLVAALAFAAYTAWVMVVAGPFGFWPDGRNPWSVQVFTDLVISLVIGLSFASAEARRRGIARWPWVIATVLLGSIGLLGFLARIAFAERSAPSS